MVSVYCVHRSFQTKTFLFIQKSVWIQYTSFIYISKIHFCSFKNQFGFSVLRSYIFSTIHFCSLKNQFEFSILRSCISSKTHLCSFKNQLDSVNCVHIYFQIYTFVQSKINVDSIYCVYLWFQKESYVVMFLQKSIWKFGFKILRSYMFSKIKSCSFKYQIGFSILCSNNIFKNTFLFIQMSI